MDIPTQHQVKVAKDTLRLSDWGVAVLGGMTKEEAREVLRVKAGWTIAQIDTFAAAKSDTRRAPRRTLDKPDR